MLLQMVIITPPPKKKSQHILPECRPQPGITLAVSVVYMACAVKNTKLTLKTPGGKRLILTAVMFTAVAKL